MPSALKDSYGALEKALKRRYMWLHNRIRIGGKSPDKERTFSLMLPQPKSGTGVRAEKRRGVSCETTSLKAFPVEDQPQMFHLTLVITPGGYS